MFTHWCTTQSKLLHCTENRHVLSHLKFKRELAQWIRAFDADIPGSQIFPSGFQCHASQRCVRSSGGVTVICTKALVSSTYPLGAVFQESLLGFCTEGVAELQLPPTQSQIYSCAETYRSLTMPLRNKASFFQTTCLILFSDSTTYPG